MTRRLRISTVTLGCKLNQYETVGMEEALRAAGHQIVPAGQPVDFCIVNTCTVTQKTDYHCRQAVRRALASSPGCGVIVTGCYSERRAEDFAQIPGVRMILGNEPKRRIVELVEDLASAAAAESPVRVVPADVRGALECQWFPIQRFADYTRAFVKVQEGCNARCAYCIVPKVRGPNRSILVETVCDQVRKLVESGYGEIVLTGVHLGTYGADLERPTNLAHLLRHLLEVEGLRRLRLSSIEPLEFDRELIDLLAGMRRLCRHLHIPLQSGSNMVLERMNRGYAREQYADLVRQLAGRISGIAIGADVMVGFPGETEPAVQETYDLIEELPLAYLHVFNYSNREGTPAATMHDQIPPPERRRRSQLLRDLGRRKWEAFRRGFVGQLLEVIVLRQREAQTGRLQGLADNYIRVLFDGPDALKDQFAEVEVTGLMGKSCTGRLVGTLPHRSS